MGGVDIHAMDDFAFRKACMNGHIEIARWLVSLGGVDIHEEYDDAFRMACRNGHMEIARWLVSLGGVDIHAADSAFRCSNRQIVEWLHTLP
jgi:ankyrin repeat protein